MNPIYISMLWAIATLVVLIALRYFYTKRQKITFFNLISDDVVKRRRQVRWLFICNLLAAFIGLIMIASIFYKFTASSFAEYYFGFLLLFAGGVNALILIREVQS